MQTQSEYTFVRRSRRITATVLSVGACLGALTMGAPSPAHADDPAGTTITKKVSLNLVNQPVQTALRLLFSSVGLNSSIDQDVQGYVTIDVNDVSFDVALRALLNAANPPLAYDPSGGVYHISVKRQAAPVFTQQAAAPTQAASTEAIKGYPIPIDNYDAGVIAQIIASSGRGGVVIVPPNYTQSGGQNGQGGGQGGRGGGFGGGQGGGQGGFGGGQSSFGGGGGFGGGGNSFGGGGGGFGGGGNSFGGGGFGGGGFGGF